MTKKLLIMLLVLTMVLSIVMLTACDTDNGDISDVTGTTDSTITLWTAALAYTEAQTEYGYEGTFEEFLASLAGITSVNINADGELIITLSDGSSLNVGNIMGQAGSVGADGVGIASTTVNDDGDLIITYTDGTSANAGTVVGVDGNNGADGSDGVDGNDGVDGQDGSDGADGSNGIGIASVTINDDGDLIITYTDGTSVNVGTVNAPATQITVTYDSNGGTLAGETTVTVDSGSKLTAPADPTRDGYIFVGWYYGDIEWVFVGYTATESMTLTAMWEQLATDGLQYELNDDGMSYSVVGIGTATDTDIYIANSYNGLPVTNIGDWAFYGCYNLTSVLIPNSVTSIGYCAFNTCVSITSIVIPASVTEIGEWAFENCCNMVEVYNLSDLEIIAGSDNYGGVAYYAVTVHDDMSEQSILSTDAYGFVTYSLGNKTVLVGYTGLATYVNIPEGITEINTYAFALNETMTSVVIPSTMTSILEGAFEGCSNILQVYNLSELDITAGSGDNGAVAYYAIVVFDSLSDSGTLATDNNGFTTFTYGDTVILVSYIGDGGEITIPYGVTEISVGAFESNETITSVEISADVITVGDSAFSNCSNLTTVTFAEYSQPISIGDYAFYGCSSLTSIDIPSSVTTIGDSAFRDCSDLDSITFGEDSQLVNIGKYVFSNCSSLTSIVIPSSVTTIGECAFSDCSSLTSIIIPSSVTVIGKASFGWCTNLGTVTFGEDSQLVTIGECAFIGCDSLASIVITASVTSIGYNAFFDCSSLTTVYNLSELEITAGSDDYGYVAYNATDVFTYLPE